MRLETKRMKEPDFPYTGKGFTQPGDVVKFYMAMRESDELPQPIGYAKLGPCERIYGRPHFVFPKTKINKLHERKALRSLSEGHLLRFFHYPQKMS